MTSTTPAVCDWQSGKRKVKQRGQYLLETGIWSDCRFIVGTEPHQQVFEGHKLFLAMSSPVFEAMFFGRMPEKDPIAILDVQPDAFRALLEYIYTDRINFTSFDQACELCYGAKKYMLPHLVEECTKYLWSDLYPKNACRAYEFAKLFEEPILMEKCLNIISNQTQEVLLDSSFEDVEFTTVLKILEQDALNIQSELELFTAITRYAARHNNILSSESNDPAVRHPIFDALMKIRFLTLSPQEFAEGPATSQLLTESEKFAILMNISSISTSVAMPQGFSISRVRRLQTSNPRPYNIDGQDTSRTSMIKFYNQGGSQSSSDDALKKLYCTRQLIQVSDCMNSSILDCTVTFTCDKNICIYGIQVPAQSILESDDVSSYSRSSYTEVLYAHLLDADGSRLTYTHFTSRANYRSLIDIFFNRPFYIQRNKAYKVGVVLHKSGVYPLGTYPDQSLCNGVMFTFGQGACGENTSTRDGLIRSIIFSVPPSNVTAIASTSFGNYYNIKGALFRS